MIVTAKEFPSIRRQAETEYPNECCGVILVKAGAGERILVPCRNIQNEKHAQDPARFPRDARTAYYVNPQDVLKIMKLDSEGFRVSTIYHSHIDVGAYFSDTDKGQAAPQGEPLYPDATYLVVSVTGRKGWLSRWLPRFLRRPRVQETRAFSWDPARQDFLPVRFEEP